MNVQVVSLPTGPGTRRRLDVAVARTDEGAETQFAVEVEEPAVVLDVLLAVQRLDPTLGFRYSCRVSMCGTCAVRVDGRPALACQTAIDAESESLIVEPLAGLPVVRDLIVDTTPFWDAWRRVEPWFVPREDGEDRALAAGDPSRAEVEAGLDCIGCGVCWTACDLTAGRKGFIGPAALNRTMVLAADPRDGARERRLRIVGGEGGVTRCHYVHGCSGACPKGLDPAASIRRLRRWGIRG
ncbi:MAG TPA: 2Fe-2S iron-sulfur cluster-binding protein [Gaiellaceae bacterium]|nr:2Fe-2S iron-sulfur cluster-binding protein [Gaiellaceae bacterium]